MSRPAHILVVEDDLQVGRALARLLRRNGLDVTTVPSAERALEELDAIRPDVIVSDYRMPGMNGGELLRIVAERDATIGRILVSGYTAQVAACGPAAAAQAVFPKPYDEQALLAAIHRLGGGR